MLQEDDSEALTSGNDATLAPAGGADPPGPAAAPDAGPAAAVGGGEAARAAEPAAATPAAVGSGTVLNSGDAPGAGSVPDVDRPDKTPLSEAFPMEKMQSGIGAARSFMSWGFSKAAETAAKISDDISKSEALKEAERLARTTGGEVVKAADRTKEYAKTSLGEIQNGQTGAAVSENVKEMLGQAAASTEAAKVKAKELAENMKPTLDEAKETAKVSLFSAAASAAKTAIWFQSFGASPHGESSDEEYHVDYPPKMAKAPVANTMGASAAAAGGVDVPTGSPMASSVPPPQVEVATAAVAARLPGSAAGEASANAASGAAGAAAETPDVGAPAASTAFRPPPRVEAAAVAPVAAESPSSAAEPKAANVAGEVPVAASSATAAPGAAGAAATETPSPAPAAVPAAASPSAAAPVEPAVPAAPGPPKEPEAGVQAVAQLEQTVEIAKEEAAKEGAKPPQDGLDELEDLLAGFDQPDLTPGTVSK